MKTKVNDVDTLQQYLTGVMQRTDHHARQVDEIVFALAGAIIWRKDSSPIEVMTRQGDMKNILWVRINDKKYAFCYNHETCAIEMRGDKIKGEVIHSFLNTTSLSELINIFRNL
jgi:Integron cassette protein VCH_CASS1 chain